MAFVATGVAGSFILALWHSTSARYGGLLAVSCALGLVILLTLWHAWRRDRLDLTSAPVLLCLVFFVPSFVLGSVFVAIGWSRPAYVSYLDNPARSMVIAELYSAIALASLWIGYRYAPVERAVVRVRPMLQRVSSIARLRGCGKPSERAVLFDACFLLLVAVVASVTSFVHDPAAHQSGAAEGSIAVLRYTASLSVTAGFMLWSVRSRSRSGTNIPSRSWARYGPWALTLFVSVVVVQSGLSGSRGSALTVAVALAVAAWTTKSEWRPSRRGVLVGLSALTVIIGGVLFGSTYRIEKQINGSFLSTETVFESPGSPLAGQQFRGLSRATIDSLQSAPHAPFGLASTPSQPPDSTSPSAAGDPSPSGAFEVQLDLTGKTLRAIADRGVGGNIEFLSDRLVERVDQVASLGLMLDQRKSLHGQERALGLDRGPAESIAAALVPRWFWPDKPVVADSRKLSGLYFRDDNNSYAITAMGDLYRLYGGFGVPLGLLVLGVVLRLLHRLLIRPGWSPYLAALYVTLLLRATNLEGFYAVIYSDMIRIGFVVLAALGVSRLLRTYGARVFGLIDTPMAVPDDAAATP